MGREIRRVPAGWEHPTEDKWDPLRGYSVNRFVSLYKGSYEQACAEWWEGAQKWQAGERPEYASSSAAKWFWDWDGGPPDRDSYGPEWTEEEQTHFQIYETVSEGTPCSPVFASLDELIGWMCQPIDRISWPQYNRGEDWQCSQGKAREQAETFAKGGWAPSGMSIDGEMMGGIEGLSQLKRGKKPADSA